MKEWLKRFSEILWLWVFRTTIVLMLWTAVDIIFSFVVLMGWGDIEFLGISYRNGFLALADRNFLVNLTVGTVVVLALLAFAYRKLKAGGGDKLGLYGLLTLFDDLGSGLLAFSVITFIHLYLHVFPHASGGVSFSTPIWMWLTSMVIFFLVRWFEPVDKSHKKCRCSCDSKENADDGVSGDKSHDRVLAG